MDYDNYEDCSVRAAIDLINRYAAPVLQAAERGDEPLPALEEFFARHDMVWNADAPVPDLAAVQQLANRLHTVFTVDDATAVAVINEVLVEAGAVPQISGHDGHDWHLHYYPQDSGLLDRVAVTAAMGLATVLTTSGTRRLGSCEGMACRDVFVDTSRNNRRRFCGDGCSNRAHVAAHRARQRSTAET